MGCCANDDDDDDDDIQLYGCHIFVFLVINTYRIKVTSITFVYFILYEYYYM